MDNIPILIYSHTDYIDILEPCIKKFHKFHPELNYILAINRIDEIDSLGITNLFSSIYTYDDTTPYFTRLTSVLNQINYKYIILNNDTHILVDKINIEYLKYIVTHMEYDNIDQFRLFPSGVDPIITSQNFLKLLLDIIFQLQQDYGKRKVY
jgi:hypothetical protein